MEHEIIIRPKPIVEFNSIEELQRHLERLRNKSDDIKTNTPYDQLTPEMIEQWKNRKLK